MENKIQTIENYIHTTQLGLDVEIIKENCYEMYDFVKYQFANNKNINGQTTPVTNLFAKYNLLLYPLPGFHSLYEGIRDTFHSINDRPEEKYYIRAWLNFYKFGEFIDWHQHWPSRYLSWHGFYCVTGGGLSHTAYQLPPDRREVIIPTINDQLVLSKSDDDYHRSSEWNYEEPRITIAFDMVPQSKLQEKKFQIINHWIPI
jgi:hypothetical protein